MKFRNLTLILLVFLSIRMAGQADRLNFTVKVNHEITTNLTRFSYFVLPGDTISLSVGGETKGKFIWQKDAGQVISNSDRQCQYMAPDNTGCYKIIIQNLKTKETMTLLVFVMVPAPKMKKGYLNGYRIGNYPKENFKNKISYQKPKGFIEVTPENENLFITPHFQLKQFLCKEKSSWPKYVVIKPLILKKLELLMDKLHEYGIKTKTLFLMSAYRTPYYNKAIGNVKYSRHQYGDAVDIYVDENLDGVMDDLNDDGISTIKDADVIQKLIEQIENDPRYRNMIGGMGKYNKTSAHTYFIHMDTRGYKARW